MNHEGILDDNLRPHSERRRNLLPKWIKVFIWIFMIFGGMSVLVLFLGLFVEKMYMSFLGLETNYSFSLIGVIISALYLFKGTVAFGLWTEKDWAVNLALVDAYVSIAVCMSTMLILPMFFEDYGWDYTLRLELVAIIPYLLKMKNIQRDWSMRSQFSTLTV